MIKKSPEEEYQFIFDKIHSVFVSEKELQKTLRYLINDQLLRELPHVCVYPRQLDVLKNWYDLTIYVRGAAPRKTNTYMQCDFKKAITTVTIINWYIFGKDSRQVEKFMNEIPVKETSKYYNRALEHLVSNMNRKILLSFPTVRTEINKHWGPALQKIVNQIRTDPESIYLEGEYEPYELMRLFLNCVDDVLDEAKVPYKKRKVFDKYLEIRGQVINYLNRMDSLLKQKDKNGY